MFTDGKNAEIVDFCAFVATVKRQNTRAWMETLATRFNRLLAATEEPHRVELTEDGLRFVRVHEAPGNPR